MKKAMILAAGKGSRLGKLGEEQPKTLLRVQHVSLLQHVIGRLISVGIESIVINLHHLGEQIEEFVSENKSFGIDIQFSHEDTLLETGGGVKKAAAFFQGEENFLVHNGDVYSEIDLSAVVKSHIRTGADATLVVNQRETSRVLLFDQLQRLVGWRNNADGAEKLVGSSGAEVAFGFCGIHAISKQLLDELCKLPEDRFSIISAYLELAAKDMNILPFVASDEPWFDVGTPEKIRALAEYLSHTTNIV